MSTSQSPAPSRTRERIPADQRRQIVSACLGTFIEWFDWSLFGLFSIYFATVFFPAENKVLSMLGAALTFAVAFAFRPLGGWLLGLYADRCGRRPALIPAMAMMTGGSFVIAVAPGYETLGVVGPVLLVLSRVAQGISAGGDSTNVYIYMAEIAPKGWRYRYAAFTYVFSGASFLLASVIGFVATSVLDADQMAAFGWRIAFVIGGLVGLYGIVARIRLTETAEFEQLAARSAAAAGEDTPVSGPTRASATAGLPAGPVRERHPLWATVTRHPGAVLKVFGFTMMMTLLYYALTVSFASYAADTQGVDEHTIFLVTTLGTIIFIALQYPFGLLADRIGPRPQLLASAAVFVVAIVPLSMLVSNTFWGLFTLFSVCMAVYAPLSSIAPVVYSDLFPASIRGTGLGTWYNIAVAVFGGTVPLVLTGLTTLGHPDWFFWYVALAALVGLLSVLAMPFLREDRGLRGARRSAEPPVPAVGPVPGQ